MLHVNMAPACCFSLALLLLGKITAGYQTERSLNGNEWTIKDSLGKLNQTVKAQVPGQVHLDLLRAGIINDPYAGWNDWLYQWIGYDNWTYLGSVDIQAGDMGKVMWLKCDGLDTIATIRVNNHVVGHASNYHRRYVFNITDVVQAGSNPIRIDFESAANYSYAQAAAYPYDLYTDIQGVFFNKSQRGFARKTQSDFGWDWGPGFVPCGIWGNISLVILDTVYISDIIPKAYYDEEQMSYFISITTCLQVLSEPAVPLIVKIQATAALGTDYIIQDEFSVSSSGGSCGTIISKPISPSVVEKDKLWWPLGISWTKKPATLTEVATKVDVMAMGVPVSSLEVMKKVGFRHLQLVQDPVGPNGIDGLTFFFQMKTSSQTYPFFAKGSNFIPMDAFVNRVTPDRARKLLTAFVDGNQNMLRVWGGGLYQPDWFYDLCDEMGIMIWQEFMFADALYPRDKDFLINVEAEIRDVVRRLGHHPSIVLWSGNNENQGILGNNTVWIVDYTVFYDETIRAALWEEDTTRIYLPSSPSNGVLVDDKKRLLFIQRWGDVSNPNYGDVHRYDYFDYCMDVSKFPKPRFVSEFGFQSYPSSRSMKNISTEADWSNDSPFMNHRNHHPTGNKQMETLIAMVFNLPANDNPEYKFLDFIYLSQVMQGLCIRAQAEHYRRMISEEGIYTRGTLYWQLNDIWQAQSWSSVEWSGQWKVLHYFMRRTYAPILVSSYQTSDAIVIYVVVDVIDKDINYKLDVDVISWQSNTRMNHFEITDLSNKGFTGVKVFDEKMDTVFKGTSPQETFLLLTVTGEDNSEPLAINWHFPANFTAVKLPDATITASGFETKGEDHLLFLLSSNAVAPFVYLENTNYYGVFSENAFLLRPGSSSSKFITFTSDQVLDVLTFQRGLTIRSIKDTYSNKPYKPNGGKN